MMDPTAKYRNLTQDPIDGTPLSWQAHPGGFPTRTQHTTPYIERQRREQATEVIYAQSKFFTLPDDNDAYTKVVDWIANGLAVLHREEIRELKGDDPKKGQWLVWMVYFDIRGYIPNESELSIAMSGGARP